MLQSDSPANPYLYDRPVGGTDVFVGRAIMLRNLQTGTVQGRNYAVFGGPKSGRTSLLQHYRHRARQARMQASRAASVVPVYLDLATCLPAGRPQALCQGLWEAVKDAVLDPHIQAHPSPPRPAHTDPGRTPHPWQVLQEVLAALWDGLAHTPGWCRYVLLLDNADVLSAATWREQETMLANWLHGPEPWRPAAWVVAGGPVWQGMASRVHSPWKGLRTQSLGVLRDAEVQLLLKIGGVDAAAAAQLVAASGKHPQVLQCLLAAWVDNGGDLPTAIATAKPTLEATFTAILQAFPPVANGRGEVAIEHDLMQLLIRNGPDILASDAEKALRRGPIKAATDFLECCGIIERHVRGSATLLRAPALLWNSYYEAALQSWQS